MLSRQSSHHWSQNDLSSVSCASMASSPTPLLLSSLGREATLSGTGSSNSSAGNQQQHNNNSSESTSSTETLKWLGSMSDVSEASHATGYSAIAESGEFVLTMVSCIDSRKTVNILLEDQSVVRQKIVVAT